MASESEFISLVPDGSAHRVVGERVVILPSITLEILTTRLIELDSWVLKGLNDPFWRLYLPTRGSARVWTELDGGRQETMLLPDHAYLIPPRTTISSTNEEPFSKWYVHFTLGQSGDRTMAGVYPVTRTEQMQDAIQQLSCQESAQLPWASATLVAEALRHLKEDVWARRRVDARVERAMQFMHANLSRKLTSEDVSAAAGLSVRNLNHLFHQHVEMSPMRILLDFRLDKACRLLRHGDDSIEQIAEDCGFPNRYYFSRMLKQHRGTSPAAYRKAEF